MLGFYLKIQGYGSDRESAIDYDISGDRPHCMGETIRQNIR
jgi:hypothetical protein